MSGDENRNGVFGPWYEYLTRFERLVLAAVTAATALLVGAGVAQPATDPGVALGAALFLTGVVAFAVRWSVSNARAERLAAFDDRAENR